MLAMFTAQWSQANQQLEHWKHLEETAVEGLGDSSGGALQLPLRSSKQVLPTSMWDHGTRAPRREPKLPSQSSSGPTQDSLFFLSPKAPEIKSPPPVNFGLGEDSPQRLTREPTAAAKITEVGRSWKAAGHQVTG